MPRGNPNPDIEKLKPYQFKPGQSGNPSGRRKEGPGTKALRELLDDPKIAKKLAKALIREACTGNPRATKEILDRVEGKVANRVEVTGADGEEIKANVQAKLSVGDLLGALATIYGLDSSKGNSPRADAAVPLSGAVGERPEPKKDRGQK